MNRRYRKFHPVKGLLFLGMVAFFLFVVGYVVMFLWNAILPDLVGVKRISYWQAVGLLVLCRILFGGFGGGKHRKHSYKKKQFWKEKWMNMDDTRREEIRDKWKGYCDRRNDKN